MVEIWPNRFDLLITSSFYYELYIIWIIWHYLWKTIQHNTSVLTYMWELDLSNGAQTKFGDVGIKRLNRCEFTKRQFQFIIGQFIKRFKKWIIEFYTNRVWLYFNLFFNNWTSRFINDIKRTSFAFFPFKYVTVTKRLFWKARYLNKISKIYK